MTTTVMIRLAGPMQSWGHLPRESQVRPTQDHPTKRGVIGLIANILGRDRTDDIRDLAGLRFGVRADRPGIIDSDYQTAGGGHMMWLPEEIMANPKWRKAAAKSDPTSHSFPATYAPARNISRDNDGNYVGAPNNSSLTAVQYIADAVFTAALSGDDLLVTQIGHALQHPARTPFLGRAAYLPSEPLYLGLDAHTDPGAALKDWPLHERSNGDVHLWWEVPPLTPGSTIIADQPVSYATRDVVGRADLHATLAAATGDAAPAGTELHTESEHSDNELADFFS